MDYYTEYLNSNISTEFQSKVMYTIINSEESENNHYTTHVLMIDRCLL